MKSYGGARGGPNVPRPGIASDRWKLFPGSRRAAQVRDQIFNCSHEEKHDRTQDNSAERDPKDRHDHNIEC
jgi:hypothetical protein